MKRLYSLREIRNRLGLSRRIIQGYEKKGLVQAADRNKYGHLLYDEETLARIIRIRFFQESGFSLKEISEWFDRPAEERKMRLAKQIEVLKKQKDRLKKEIEIICTYMQDDDDKKLEEAIMAMIREEKR